MATIQELEAAFLKADAAGNADDARTFANEIRRMRSAGQQASKEPKIPEYTQSEIFQNAANEGFSAEDGELMGSALRPVGLTARYGLEGVAQSIQPFTEPARIAMDAALGTKSKPAGQIASDVANTIGLPSPRDAKERVVGDISRAMAGAGSWTGAGQKLGQLFQGALNGGVTRGVLSTMAEAPAAQAFSGGASGLASGVTREAGGGDVAQGIAGVLGGFGSMAGLNAAQSVGRRAAQGASRVLNPAASAAEAENAVAQALSKQGVDWSAIPQNIKNGMIKEVEQALKAGGDLNPAILERLLDFRTVGATPTRGTLTQNPGLITREKNLAKITANSPDGSPLALVENENNARLIESVNNLGAKKADDAFSAGSQMFDAGEAAKGALKRSIDAEQSNINQLYDAARDSAGRSAELNRSAFTNRANDLLEHAMVGGELPIGVRNRLNSIAQGEMPFTVEVAEQLKTQIGKLQRSTTDGQKRYALGLVRQALDETPLWNTAKSAPVSASREVGPALSNLGEEAILAFNKARVQNRKMMQKIESSPALKAIYDEKAVPDDFIQQFIIGQNKKASVEDVKKLASDLKAIDPASFEAVKGAIAQRLKTAAIGAGTAEDVGKFNAARFRSALGDIGALKMSAFFNPDEMRKLRAISNVANLTTSQPVGSAVNNSNSGALALARGYGLDWLSGIARNTPIVRNIPKAAEDIRRSVQQRAARDITPVLTSRDPLATAPQSAPATSPAALIPAAVHTPSQKAERDFSPDEYQYVRNAAMRAGDYDAVRILDNDARMRGYIR